MMVAACEDELICDMAETYHVFNWRELPLRLAATLAIGLDAESRVRRKLAGDEMRLDTMLRAAILDQLQILRWYQTEDGQKGQNPPEMMVDMLRGRTKRNKARRVTAFARAEDFEARRRKIIGGHNGR